MSNPGESIDIRYTLHSARSAALLVMAQCIEGCIPEIMEKDRHQVIIDDAPTQATVEEYRQAVMAWMAHECRELRNRASRIDIRRTQP
jgi:hypothetical protein